MNSKLDLFRRRPIGEKILQSWDVTNTVSGCNWRDVFLGYQLVQELWICLSKHERFSTLRCRIAELSRLVHLYDNYAPPLIGDKITWATC